MAWVHAAAEVMDIDALNLHVTGHWHSSVWRTPVLGDGMHPHWVPAAVHGGPTSS